MTTTFREALENVWELISRVNKYIVENEPWVLAEKPAEAGRLDSVLFHAAESLRVIAALLAPVIPKTAQNLWEQLGMDGQIKSVDLAELRWGRTWPERQIRGGTSLFPRLDPKEVIKKMESAADQRAGAGASEAATASLLRRVILRPDHDR